MLCTHRHGNSAALAVPENAERSLSNLDRDKRRFVAPTYVMYHGCQARVRPLLCDRDEVHPQPVSLSTQ